MTAWAFGIIGLLAITFAVYALYMNRRIRRKNRALVREITNALEYKKRDEMNEEFRMKNSSFKDLSDADLFLYLDHAIRHEKLYLSPTFGRKTLTDLFHLSNQRIGAAFAKGSSHRSLSEYIRKLRVEYACRLLTEHPEMTVAKVGTASGFSIVSVFCRSFKEHIQMTPYEFKRLKAAD